MRADPAPVTAADVQTFFNASDWRGGYTKAVELTRTDPVQGNLLAARASLEDGDAARARAHAKAALSLQPRNRRALLTLSVAHLEQSQNARAAWYLRRALDVSTTQAQRTEVRALLGAVGRARTWEWTGDIALVPTTNAGRATNATTIDSVLGVGEIQGIEVVRTVGLETSFRGVRKFTLPSGISGGVGFGAASALFRESELNQYLLNFDVSLRTPQQDGKFKFGQLGVVRRLREGTAPEDFITASLGQSFRTANDRQVSFGGSIGKVLRHSDHRRDAETLGVFGAYAIPLSPTSSLLFSANLQRNISDAPDINNVTSGFSGTFVRLFADRWQIRATGALNLSFWNDREPLFEDPRSERRVRLSLSGTDTTRSFLGLNPSVGISYERNFSNIDLFEFESVDFNLGLERNF